MAFELGFKPLIKYKDTRAAIDAQVPFPAGYYNMPMFSNDFEELRWVKNDGTLTANLLDVHAAVTVTDSTSIDFTLTGQDITAVVLPAAVDHDLLLNFVANEHVDHSTVSIATAADTGLAGGGDLTATRNLTVDITNTTAETTVAGTDEILMYDVTASALRKVTVTNLLTSVAGGLVLQGGYNATANTPTLVDGTGEVGQFYQVTTAGSQDLGSGTIEMNVGDWIVYDGADWYLADNSSQVNSVNGQTGIVSLTFSDLTDIPVETTGTTASYTPVWDDNTDTWGYVDTSTFGSFDNFLIGADTGTDATITDGLNVQHLGGTNIATTITGTNITYDWSANLADLGDVPAPPTGGATKVQLEWDDATDAFAWVTGAADQHFYGSDLPVATAPVNHNQSTFDVTVAGAGKMTYGQATSGGSRFNVNGDVEVLGNANGIIIASDTGARYRLNLIEADPANPGNVQIELNAV